MMTGSMGRILFRIGYYQQRVEGRPRLGVTRNLFGLGKVVGVWGGGVSVDVESQQLKTLGDTSARTSLKERLLRGIIDGKITFNHTPQSEVLAVLEGLKDVPALKDLAEQALDKLVPPEEATDSMLQDVEEAAEAKPGEDTTKMVDLTAFVKASGQAEAAPQANAYDRVGAQLAELQQAAAMLKLAFITAEDTIKHGTKVVDALRNEEALLSAELEKKIAAVKTWQNDSIDVLEEQRDKALDERRETIRKGLTIIWKELPDMLTQKLADTENDPLLGDIRRDFEEQISDVQGKAERKLTQMEKALDDLKSRQAKAIQAEEQMLAEVRSRQDIISNKLNTAAKQIGDFEELIRAIGEMTAKAEAFNREITDLLPQPQAQPVEVSVSPAGVAPARTVEPAPAARDFSTLAARADAMDPGAGDALAAFVNTLPGAPLDEES